MAGCEALPNSDSVKLIINLLHFDFTKGDNNSWQQPHNAWVM